MQMPAGTYAVDVEAPLEQVWRFLKDPANWEPLMTGYIGHEIVNERESTWTFKGDLGITTKLIKLQVSIKELAEPSRIAFQLSGLSDPVEGAGRFEAVSLGKNLNAAHGISGNSRPRLHGDDDEQCDERVCAEKC